MKILNLLAILTIVVASTAVQAKQKNNCNLHLILGTPASDQLLCKDGFAIGYSYKHKQPLWVSAYLTENTISPRLTRSNDYREDEEIPKKYRATLADFSGSGYDRGHIQSAASVDYSQKSMSESFLLSNMSPQLKGFNRNGFRKVERDLRQCIYKYEIAIQITGTLFDERQGLPPIGNGVSVPTAFYKILYAHDEYGNDLAMGMILPHRKFSKVINPMIVPIDIIETLTGLDFLSKLDDKIENRIEASSRSMCLFAM